MECSDWLLFDSSISEVEFMNLESCRCAPKHKCLFLEEHTAKESRYLSSGMNVGSRVEWSRLLLADLCLRPLSWGLLGTLSGRWGCTWQKGRVNERLDGQTRRNCTKVEGTMRSFHTCPDSPTRRPVIISIFKKHKLPCPLCGADQDTCPFLLWPPPPPSHWDQPFHVKVLHPRPPQLLFYSFTFPAISKVLYKCFKVNNSLFIL